MHACARLLLTVGLLLSATLAVGARPALAAGCPLVLDRVIEAYPRADEATAESRHLADFTLTFLANVPAFTSVDIAGRWSRGKTLAHQTTLALAGKKRPFVTDVFTTYDDRTHGTLLDVWISGVVETDGTRVTCRHAMPMKRQNDRLFPGAIELVSVERLRDQTATERIAALATPTPAPPATPSTSPSPIVAASADPSQACPIPNAPAAIVNYVRAESPQIARQQGASGTTVVLVNVDAQGYNRSERVYRSSGNAALDESAITAARNSTYQPAFASCVPIPGQYYFRADFSEQ